MAEQATKVGGRIAELRVQFGWSRPELARRLPGMSTGNDVYRWETGKHVPRNDTLDAIARALDTTVADLYSGPWAERPEPDLETPAHQPLDVLSVLELPKYAYEAIGATVAEISIRTERQLDESREHLVAEIKQRLDQLEANLTEELHRLARDLGPTEDVEAVAERRRREAVEEQRRERDRREQDRERKAG